jgi:hypothetical protein
VIDHAIDRLPSVASSVAFDVGLEFCDRSQITLRTSVAPENSGFGPLL